MYIYEYRIWTFCVHSSMTQQSPKRRHTNDNPNQPAPPPAQCKNPSLHHTGARGRDWWIPINFPCIMRRHSSGRGDTTAFTPEYYAAPEAALSKLNVYSSRNAREMCETVSSATRVVRNNIALTIRCVDACGCKPLVSLALSVPGWGTIDSIDTSVNVIMSPHAEHGVACAIRHLCPARSMQQSEQGVLNRRSISVNTHEQSTHNSSMSISSPLISCQSQWITSIYTHADTLWSPQSGAITHRNQCLHRVCVQTRALWIWYARRSRRHGARQLYRP